MSKVQLNEEDKKYLLSEYLRNIARFADINYQKRIWIYLEDLDAQAFDDAVCDFFDIGDPILQTYKEFGISDYQYHLLLNFRNAFERVTSAPDPSLTLDFIDTPEWRQIIEMAKEVLEVFNYKHGA